MAKVVFPKVSRGVVGSIPDVTGSMMSCYYPRNYFFAAVLDPLDFQRLRAMQLGHGGCRYIGRKGEAILNSKMWWKGRSEAERLGEERWLGLADRYTFRDVLGAVVLGDRVGKLEKAKKATWRVKHKKDRPEI